MKKEFHLTKEGVAELEAELESLKKQRVEIARKIKIARDHGDLTENAEYQNAREEQGTAESRIAEIEHILSNVELIEEPKNSGTVELGNTVALKSDGGEKHFTIVGSVEANPAENKISDESPIGQALLGKKVGDDVTIELPNGPVMYKVKAIS